VRIERHDETVKSPGRRTGPRHGPGIPVKIGTSTLLLLASVGVGIATNKVSETFTWAWTAGLAMFVLGSAVIQAISILSQRRGESSATTRDPDDPSGRIDQPVYAPGGVVYAAARDIVVGHPGSRLFVLALAGILASAVTVLTTVVLLRTRHDGGEAPPEPGAAGSATGAEAAKRREEALLSELQPGGTYPRLQQLLDQEPDRRSDLSSGYVVQFERPYEYVQVVVGDDGNVRSVGVLLRDGTLRPPRLGAWDAPFGRSIAEYEEQTGIMVSAFVVTAPGVLPTPDILRLPHEFTYFYG
jgi:hypothetical protein